MSHYLRTTRTERTARRAEMFRRYEIVDPGMLRVALAEQLGVTAGKRSARRFGRPGHRLVVVTRRQAIEIDRQARGETPADPARPR